jgi:hypothetical protein
MPCTPRKESETIRTTNQSKICIATISHWLILLEKLDHPVSRRIRKLLAVFFPPSPGIWTQRQQESMATFHLFLDLPIEIRIQIWESTPVQGRVIKVRELHFGSAYGSPTPVPAVTQACQESRKYCSYQKAFVMDQSPRYIWVDFESDIIQMNCEIMSRLVLEKNRVKHLRIALSHELGWDLSEFFFHDYSYKIRDFPQLKSCDVLVNDGPYYWGNFIKETDWGACQQSNVRIIDAKTGEWINAETAGPY